MAVYVNEGMRFDSRDGNQTVNSETSPSFREISAPEQVKEALAELPTHRDRSA